jgi:hypothetical protein
VDDLEPEQLQDDLEEKIIPLPQTDDAQPSFPLRGFRKPHISPRQYRLSLRLSLVLSVILLLLLVLSGSPQLLRNATFGALGSAMPTPTATLFGEENTFYMDVSVPWTKVFLDGHLIHPPRNNEIPLKLARGRHLIEWHAEPFQNQSCIMSVPFALSGTCAFAVDEPGLGLQDPFAEMILLHDSLTSLPAGLRATLIGAVQQAFAKVPTSQLVQPGELYAGPDGYTTATQPLKATLHFQFEVQATGDQPYLIAGEVCQQLCIVPWRYLPSQKIVSPASTQAWLALAFITATWEYATADGRVIAHDQPIDLAGAGNSAYPVLLRILWNGSGWDVKPLIGPDQVPPIVVTTGLPHDPSTPPDQVQLHDNPSCIAARDLIGISPANFQVRFVSGSNVATGCLAIVTGNSTNAPSSSGPQVAYFLEHFGILLAVNDAAHKLEPGAPLADAYERSLAQQLAAL